MSVELNQLLKLVPHMDITLLAGDAGLSNMVSWIHMVETQEASSFLDGGEIAFSTGIGLNNGFSLLDLVKSVWEHKASGIIINSGPFIEKVPDEVIEFGKTHNFPIFTIPWKIHIAEIMRIFCFTITKSTQKNLEIAAAFKNAIFFPKQEELYMVPLSQRDFNVDWPYCVCVIKMNPKLDITEKYLDELCDKIDLCLCHHFNHYAIFPHHKELLIVMGNYTDQMVHALIDCMLQYLHLTLPADFPFSLGIGKITKSIRCLYKSYHQAIAIENLQEKGKIKDTLIYYDDMGIYKLLMAIEDSDIIKDYYEKTLYPLRSYDEQKGSDLTTVLRTYLEHNGSVKDTADELYVHRNTINYKLNKIEELLNIDLSDLNTRLQLNVSFMLQDMF